MTDQTPILKYDYAEIPISLTMGIHDLLEAAVKLAEDGSEMPISLTMECKRHIALLSSEQFNLRKAANRILRFVRYMQMCKEQDRDCNDMIQNAQELLAGDPINES